MERIQCMINDEPYEIVGVSPTMSLLHYLRDVLRLTGTKEGCNEGDCGACTVVFRDDSGDTPRYRAVNSCLVYLPMLHGKRIYTIEGISRDGGRHPVQESIMRNYASQCGYCTPGVAMSLFEATYRHDMKEPWQFVEQMSGNLCRCTGYRPIMECVRQVAGTGDDDFARKLCEPAMQVESLDYSAEGFRFFVPNTLEEALEFKAEHPEACVVAGASDVGVMINKTGARAATFLALCNIRELRAMREESDRIFIGATARLADVELFCQERFRPLGSMLRYFSAHQIKQIACMGGSVAGGSPVGDIAPVLAATNATLCLRSQKSGVRKLRMDEFILGYRKTSIAPDEILVGFELAKLAPGARCASYKVSKRQELDISSVAAAFYVETDDENRVVAARFAYGGMAAVPGARAKNAEAAIIGKLWNEENVEGAAAAIEEDFKPISDFRASAWYRITVAANLLRGFYHETLEERQPKRAYRPYSTLQLEM